MVDTEIDAAWRAFLDAIADCDFISEEIALLPDGDPQKRKPGLIAAFHEAAKRRDEAREVVSELLKVQS